MKKISINKKIHYNILVEIVIIAISVFLSMILISRCQEKFSSRTDCLLMLRGFIVILAIITIGCGIGKLCSFNTSKEKEFLSTFFISKKKYEYILFSKVKYINTFITIFFSEYIYIYEIDVQSKWLITVFLGVLFYINIFFIEHIIVILIDLFQYIDIAIIFLVLILVLLFAQLDLNLFLGNDQNQIVVKILLIIGKSKILGNIFNNLTKVFLGITIISTCILFLYYCFYNYNLACINKTLLFFKGKKGYNKKLVYRNKRNGFIYKDFLIGRQMKITLVQILLYLPISIITVYVGVPESLILIECIIILVLNSAASTYIFSFEEEHLNLLKSLAINEKDLIKYKLISMYIYNILIPCFLLILSLIVGNISIYNLLIGLLILNILCVIYTLTIVYLCNMFFMNIQKSYIMVIMAVITYLVPPIGIIFISIAIKHFKKLENIEV